MMPFCLFEKTNITRIMQHLIMQVVISQTNRKWDYKADHGIVLTRQCSRDTERLGFLCQRARLIVWNFHWCKITNFDIEYMGLDIIVCYIALCKTDKFWQRILKKIKWENRIAVRQKKVICYIICWCHNYYFLSLITIQRFDEHNYYRWVYAHLNFQSQAIHIKYIQFPSSILIIGIDTLL